MNGQVTISTKEYNELRDFKDKLENGKCYTINSICYGKTHYYYNKEDSEVIKSLIKSNHKLNKDFKFYKEQSKLNTEHLEDVIKDTCKALESSKSKIIELTTKKKRNIIQRILNK